jgi:hypothetical protein
MNKRSILFSVAVLLITPITLRAQVIFSEVMYDLEGTDTGREWIEIYNGGASAIDLSTWKIFEANTNHRIAAVDVPILLPGAYAVVADVPDKFKIDFPGFSGLLFDSAFSLNNEGETLMLRDENNADIDTLAYTSAFGGQNGASIHKKDGTWINALPTPGGPVGEFISTLPEIAATTTTETNPLGQTTGTTANSGTSSYSSHSNQADASVHPNEPAFVVSAGRARLGFVGVPLSFEAKIKSIKSSLVGNTIHHYWSFGDGTSVTGQFVSHIYEYPGDYVVILTSDGGAENAVAKTKVRITEPKVDITIANDAYVELHNQGSFEVNVGDWILGSGHDRTSLAKDTIIEPGSKIKIPIKNTKLREAKDELYLALPLGGLASTYHIDNGSQYEMEISIPSGISEASIREKYQIALDVEAYKRSLAREDHSQVVEDMAVSSSSQDSFATVVLTVPTNHKENSWWGKLISSLKK